VYLNSFVHTLSIVLPNTILVGNHFCFGMFDPQINTNRTKLRFMWCTRSGNLASWSRTNKTFNPEQWIGINHDSTNWRTESTILNNTTWAESLNFIKKQNFMRCITPHNQHNIFHIVSQQVLHDRSTLPQILTCLPSIERWNNNPGWFSPCICALSLLN